LLGMKVVVVILQLQEFGESQNPSSVLKTEPGGQK